ncbi:DUF6082 family protein [Streptosporangium sp. NPDC023963]|uniref:DUF6082 family protein n=1 Tax=Streptosporangium sp. NPDC023963 TaxID=3155608 RepID=UPI00342D377C
MITRIHAVDSGSAPISIFGLLAVFQETQRDVLEARMPPVVQRAEEFEPAGPRTGRRAPVVRSRRLLNGPAGAGRRFLTLALLFLVILALLGFMVISPFFLAPLNDQATDWSKLNDIGQHHGAASAVLAAFALTGVALSLILQAREAKANSVRSRLLTDRILIGHHR